MRRNRMTTIALITLTAVACGHDEGAPTNEEIGSENEPPRLEHDFGVIPHGHTRSHTFALSVPGGAVGYSPVGYNSGCSCGSANFQARNQDGDVRDLTGLPFEQQRIREGEELLLEITINTNLKEAADLPTVTTSAIAHVQNVHAPGPRIPLPIVFHFAIDAPIAVLPTAHVNFGALARSRPYSQTLRLRPDPGTSVEFGPVDTTDPRLTAVLTHDSGKHLLDLRFEPGAAAQTGPVLMAVQVKTDLEGGYLLEIPVSGEIIPDIVVEPYPRIGFGRLDLATSAEHFVQIYDHDLAREPGFVVHSLTDAKGNSLADHFECRMEPLPGNPRGTRVFLRYLGRMKANGFRGILHLTKPSGEPTTKIDFVGFHRSQ